MNRLQIEAERLSTIYHEHKDSDNDFLRKKVHVDLDRFLMEHREIAIVLMAQGLKEASKKEVPKKSWRALVARLLEG